MENNYIIFGNDWDLAKFSFSDLFDMKNVTYVESPGSLLNEFQSFVFHVHLSGKIYKYVHLPFKKKWTPLLLRNLPLTSENLVCIFFTRWTNFVYKEGYFYDYIKKINPNAKFVWFLQDLYSHNKKFDELNVLDEVQKYFDLIISFDQGDCKKYGFTYHPLVISEYKGVVDNMPSSDVYFLGQAKDRLAEIYSMYHFLHDAGLKCDFFVTGVDKADQLDSDDIRYTRLTYQENLQHILHTKCLLELMQHGGEGYTQRGCEAVAMDKLLMTNNSMIEDAPFYNSQYIFKFADPADISNDIIDKIRNFNSKADYQYKQKLSPKELLDFIQEKLQNS